MRNSLGQLLAGGVFLAALNACASQPQEAARGPSPRPECALANGVIYFDQDSATLSAASTPVIRELVERLAACRAAGGDALRISVTAYPDRDATRRESRAEVEARARSVRNALVQAGAPAALIRIERYRERPDEGEQIMQRRAEVELELW